MLSHSDNGGVTWSAPVRVSGPGENDVTYVTLAAARNGTVYVAWTDETNYSVRIVRSTDGGRPAPTVSNTYEASTGQNKAMAMAAAAATNCR